MPPKRTKKKSSTPEIPAPFYANLANQQSECTSLAQQNQELQYQIDTNNLRIKRITQTINQDSFDALLKAGLDAREYVTDLDTLTFKRR